jgi:uncharacterized membrane protein YjgN (DUF898 family)
MILLTIVTLGLYQIYWTYKTRQELVAQKQDVPPFKLLLAPILILLVLIPLQVAYRFMENTGSNAAINIISIVLGVLALLVMVPIGLYWFYKYCKAVEEVTEGDLTFGMSYGLFIAAAVFSVNFLWPFLIQYSFNKLSDTPIEVPVPKIQ